MRLSAGGASGTPGASGAPHPAGVQRRALLEAARFERGRPRLASPPSPASTRNSWRCSSPRPWARSETSFFIRGIYLTGHFFIRGIYLTGPFLHFGASIWLAHLFIWGIYLARWSRVICGHCIS